MFLSYLALAILVVVIVVVVYAFIWIHDIPYMLAKKRNHPNLHAIHIACWLSLFTLHALWPFVFIWAIAQKPRLEVIVVEGDFGGATGPAADGKKSLDSADAATLRQPSRNCSSGSISSKGARPWECGLPQVDRQPRAAGGCSGGTVARGRAPTATLMPCCGRHDLPFADALARTHSSPAGYVPRCPRS